MGHEYVGVVEEVGAAVRTVKPGDFVVGSFFASDNTCEICRAGYQCRCVDAELMGAIGTQAELRAHPAGRRHARRHPGQPADELVPSLLAASDVLGHRLVRRRRARRSARARPSRWSATVRSGCSACSPREHLGAERIIAMSRHADRQHLAPAFGATDIVAERGDEGVARVKELTDGLGAHSVIEAVGTQESMMQAIRSTRPGGHVGYVGVAHDVALPGDELFFSGVHLHGGPAPVRRFLPELIDLIWTGRSTPARSSTSTLPLDEAAEGYRAMDERRAIKVAAPPLMARTPGARGPASRGCSGILLLLPACGSAPPSGPAPAPHPRTHHAKDHPPDVNQPRRRRPRRPTPDRPQRSDQPADRDESTSLTVTVGDREFTAEVGDSPPARELLAQLPLRLGFRDLNGVEKVAPLPGRSPWTGCPPGADPEIDDLGYYAPTAELVLYYGDVGYFEGIVRLGRLDPALGALLESGPDEVEVALRVD